MGVSKCGGMVDTTASKAGARVGVRVRLPRLVLGEAKRFNTSARVRVLLICGIRPVKRAQCAG